MDDTCTVAGCTKKLFIRKRGLCRGHYNKHKRETDPVFRQKTIDDAMAWSYANKELLAARATHRYRTDPAHRQKLLDRQRAAYKNNPAVREKAKKYNWKRLGFTPELVAYLRELQQGKCAICSKALRAGRREHDAEYSDHCHETHKARGFLCMICNTALGMYQKYQRPAGMRAAPYEDYLDNPPAATFDGPLPLAVASS